MFEEVAAINGINNIVISNLLKDSEILESKILKSAGKKITLFWGIETDSDLTKVIECEGEKVIFWSNNEMSKRYDLFKNIKNVKLNLCVNDEILNNLSKFNLNNLTVLTDDFLPIEIKIKIYMKKREINQILKLDLVNYKSYVYKNKVKPILIYDLNI